MINGPERLSQGYQGMTTSDTTAPNFNEDEDTEEAGKVVEREEKLWIVVWLEVTEPLRSGVAKKRICSLHCSVGERMWLVQRHYGAVGEFNSPAS